MNTKKTAKAVFLLDRKMIVRLGLLRFSAAVEKPILASSD